MASSLPVCWPETIHVNGCFGIAVDLELRAPNSWPYCESVNAQNFCSIPRGPPIKMLLHSLPANRTCNGAKRSCRLSIIMNSEWNGVVGDCFSWKAYFFFFLLKIRIRKYWMLCGGFIFKWTLQFMLLLVFSWNRYKTSHIWKLVLELEFGLLRACI